TAEANHSSSGAPSEMSHAWSRRLPRLSVRKVRTVALGDPAFGGVPATSPLATNAAAARIPAIAPHRTSPRVSMQAPPALIETLAHEPTPGAGVHADSSPRAGL